MTKEKWYKVFWTQRDGAISYVKAKSKKEAKQLAYEGKDTDWESDSEVFGRNPDWDIDSVDLTDEKDDEND